MKEIEQTKYLNETLQRRNQRMNEIINVFETRIEYEENICLKEADITDLKKLIKSLTSTVVTTS
jgi:hypothetical protein